MTKVLYAIQATGNGHISRALEVLPVLSKYTEVDVLLSGTQADIQISHPIKYQLYGLSFMFGNTGSVDILKTFKYLKPKRVISDIYQVPVQNYDLVINDFEPISAWACKLKGLPCIGLSHQASFSSSKTPRPIKVCRWSEILLKHYAPTSAQFGLHFKSYDENINTPIIRTDIRSLKTSKKDFVIVYLPAYHHEVLIPHLTKVKEVDWRVFSKKAQHYYQHENVHVYPICKDKWLESLAECEGALLGAGFESPSEALHLNKRLIVVPMKNQYEQQCNARSLQQLGVPIINSIDNSLSSRLKSWLRDTWSVSLEFPDNTESLVRSMMIQYL